MKSPKRSENLENRVEIVGQKGTLASDIPDQGVALFYDNSIFLLPDPGVPGASCAW